MTQLMQALTQFFSTMFVFFSMTEKFAKAGEHVATVAEESAGAYADEARIKRVAQIKEMQKKYGLTAAEAKQIAAQSQSQLVIEAPAK